MSGQNYGQNQTIKSAECAWKNSFEFLN